MVNSTQEAKVFTAAFNLIDKWQLQGKWQDAQTLLAGLHPVAAQLDNDAQATLWLYTGRILTDEGAFGGKDTLEKREIALNKALEFAKLSSSANLLGSAYDALGFSLHVRYIDSDRTKEPENELAFFQRGLELRQKDGTKSQIAESIFHIGVVHDVIRKDYETALKYHQEAYDLAREADDKVTASYAIRHIAFTHIAANELETAQEALEESLRLREEVGFIPGTAFALAALANLDMRKGDRESALTRLERSRDMLQALGAISRVAWVERHITSLKE